MPISTFGIPFPDFVLNTLIDPEQFDQNNASIVAKINEVINDYNNFVTATNTSIENHKNSSDHDTRYDAKYATKSELSEFAKGGIKVKIEVFTITSDPINNAFTYTNKNGVTRNGTINGSGKQIFALEEGAYELSNNTVEVIINDTLIRSAASGGLTEIDPTHVGLNTVQPINTEVTIKYFDATGVAIIETGAVAPTNVYIGKVWVDTN